MYNQRIESALSVCEAHILGLDPSDIKHKELEVYIGLWASDANCF